MSLSSLNRRVGRHRLRYHWLHNSGRHLMTPSYEQIETASRWELFYRTPYSEMVGARVRRARTRRDLTQGALVDRVERPKGGYYSRGLISRIEKGHANSPLYVYMHISDALDLDPGRLMGSDETQKPISEAEMTMVRFLRRAGIKPDAAIAMLARASRS